MDNSENSIITIRCEDAIRHVPGSIKKQCIRCKKDVWVSPASQLEKIDNCICINCIKLREINDIIITPAAQEEINYYMRKKEREM